MTSPSFSKSPASRAESPLLLAERISGSIVWAVGLAALGIASSNAVIWWSPPLQDMLSEWPGAMVMRLNTGLAIATAALSLLMWHLGGRGPKLNWPKVAAVLLALIPTTIGAFTTAEYLLGTNIGTDSFFAAPTFAGDHAHAHVVTPGRMSFNAALSLLFLGLSLCSLDVSLNVGRQRRVFTAPILAVIAALPACFGLAGYMSGTGMFTGVLKSTNLLLHTAVALVLVAVGVLAVRSDRQPVRRILSQGAGGILLRWLLPGSTLSLIILAALISKARFHGLVVQGEGTALMLFGGLFLLYTLIVAASRAIDAQEAKTLLAKSALREEEQRSQSILETSLDGVLLMDMHGRVADWNLAAERIFGWRREEVLGQLLADYIIPERLREAHARGLARYLKTGVAAVLGRRLELPALHLNGTEFPVELSINSVAHADPPMFVGFIRDITERQRAEQALREAKEQAEKASQAKDDFLAALSHELRTPLTPVLLSSSTLSQDSRLPDDVRHSLAMIERHVSLEARLIDDLLDLTRITRGKLLLRVEMCDPAELIHHALAIIQDEADSKGLKIDLQLAPLNGRLPGDSARLQQVFWNLLKNAVKFTPAGGTITVAAHPDEASQSLVVEVRDTGIGFEPGRANQLFLPFEQEKSGLPHQFGGLGLGLAIARAIVNLHGGAITAASPGTGQGAVFRVTLPSDAQTENAGQALSPEKPAGKAVGQTFRILLVEDHEATRQVMALLLKRAGHEVTAADSVAQALEVMSAAQALPEVLISDLGLPDGSGLDIMQALRTQGHSLPGIALSGYGMEEDLQRSREAGFVAHLVKPVKFDQLQQTLAQIQSPGGSGHPAEQAL